MDRIVHVENISKKFGEHTIFKNFSMEIQRGEFVVITGESGSGKSTLLNMIGLLDSPDSGNITLFSKKNVKPFSKAAEQLLRNNIGYLFQNFALIDNKSVLYNMKVALLKKDKEKSNELIQKALQKVGLKGYEEKRIYECSGGEQQRIAIARLLIKSCELILADEPTGSLDEDNKEEVFRLLKELQDEGKTIVVVSHDHGIIPYANRTIHLHKHLESTL